MMENELLKFIVLIDSRLEGARIPYMLTGSVAMTFYAVPRMTRDVDIVVQCDPTSQETLMGLFSTDCYIDRDEVSAALRSGTMFNIIHNESLIKADLIPRRAGQFRDTEFGRRRRMSIPNGACWVVSPEDLILSKLEWSKASGSELQRRDIAALLHALPHLDRDYLRKWAADLEVAGALDQAMKS